MCGTADTRVVAEQVRDFEYAAPGMYRWVECRGCGLVRLDPMPTDDVLAAAYPPSYHAYAEPSFALVRWYVGKRRQARARQLAALLPAGGTVLDVGCGAGSLLADVGRHGKFRLLGVEYRPEAAEIARSRGITVWTGELADADIPDKSVDLVVMEHVIEHVRDPRRTLERIARLLEPGGTIVGETPNLACPEMRWFDRYWGGGHAPRHLHLFTPDVLSNALRRTGFEDIEIVHPVYPAHAALSVQNWLRRHRRDSAGLNRGRAWYYPLVCSAMMPYAILAARTRRSGAIRFVARKPT